MNTTAQARTLPASFRVGDYLELTKPRLVSLVLVTTGVGFCLGWTGPMDLAFFGELTSTIVGTVLVAGGAMVLNQFAERESDARMHRTMGRPLPTGRVAPGEALVFGCVLAASGVAYLGYIVDGRVAWLAALTVASYVLAYTPLKRRTPLCTLVGAVPGAIPPMMGYVAAAHAVTVEAWVLFAILFAWQMPHFFAIAWLYRADYARGGQRVLPVVDPSGVRTARQIVGFCAALLPATIAPRLAGMTGDVYLLGAAVLGLVFLGFGVLVAAVRTDAAARRMFLISVVYLPLLLGLMVVDRTVR